MEAIRAGLPNGTPIELWWQDEARVGQKNKIARRWARRGTRPRAPHDQRTSSVYIFGAICPQEGKGAALVLPRCDTQAMSLHLAEVAQAVAPGAHGVLLDASTSLVRAGPGLAADWVVRRIVARRFDRGVVDTDSPLERSGCGQSPAIGVSEAMEHEADHGKGEHGPGDFG